MWLRIHLNQCKTLLRHYIVEIGGGPEANRLYCWSSAQPVAARICRACLWVCVCLFVCLLTCVYLAIALLTKPEFQFLFLINSVCVCVCVCIFTKNFSFIFFLFLLWWCTLRGNEQGPVRYPRMKICFESQKEKNDASLVFCTTSLFLLLFFSSSLYFRYSSSSSHRPFAYISNNMRSSPIC